MKRTYRVCPKCGGILEGNESNHCEVCGTDLTKELIYLDKDLIPKSNVGIKMFKQSFLRKLITLLVIIVGFISIMGIGYFISRGPSGHIDIQGNLVVKVGESVPLDFRILSLPLNRVELAIDTNDRDEIKEAITMFSYEKTTTGFLIKGLKPGTVHITFIFHEDKEQTNYNSKVTIQINN